MSRICGRCQKPIKAGEPYDEFIPDSGSAPTVRLHREECMRAPHQSAPVERRRWGSGA